MAIKFHTAQDDTVYYDPVHRDPASPRITCPNACGRMIRRGNPQEFWCPKCGKHVTVPPEPQLSNVGLTGLAGTKPNSFHLNGLAPRPSNAACTVSKVVGQPCPTCKCPAFYVEVERQFSIHHDSAGVECEIEMTPQINRIICANCRKRTHEQIGSKLALLNCPKALGVPYGPHATLLKEDPDLKVLAGRIDTASAGIENAQKIARQKIFSEACKTAAQKTKKHLVHEV